MNYKEFGTLLLDDKIGARINAIEHELSWNAEMINSRIMTEWINSGGINCKPVTWETLIEVLFDIEKGQLASDIQQTLSGLQPT